jgi:hypothetical protein
VLVQTDLIQPTFGGGGLIRMVPSILHFSLLPSARDIDGGGGGIIHGVLFGLSTYLMKGGRG